MSVREKEQAQTAHTNRAPMGKGPMGGGMGGGMGGEKARNFKKSWARLIYYGRAVLPAVMVALLFAVVGTVLEILGPDRLKSLTDEITKGIPRLVDGAFVVGDINMRAVLNIGIVLICFYSASALLKLFQHLLMASITQKLSRQMRSDISKKINKLPFSYFHKVSYGDVLSRVTNDVDAIGQTLNQSVATLVIAATMFIGSIIMMFITNWLLAVTAIMSSIAGFAIMIIIISKSQKFFLAQQRELGKLNGHIEEIYTGHNIVKVYGASSSAKREFETINTQLYASGWKSQFFSGLMMPLMGFIGNFGYVAVCVVGAALALNGKISFGVIIAFMIYVRLFTQPLSQFAQAANNLQRTAAASERVFELLEEKELDDESLKLSSLNSVVGDIEFRNVKFGYTAEKTVIKDFSAKVKAGQKVAIVGPTGAGKTTMVNLLMRFYEIDSGEILIDNVPINSLKRETVHEQFCMVLQDTWLFEDTVFENIVYSKSGVSKEQVVEACKTVGLHHFIATLPKGYDTILNDKASLSEGQKQLLTIARAIIKDAPLLILDEATSSVDTRTERIVQAAMDNLMQGRTSFVIAHRLSTIKNADLILVMKDGDIIESGKHERLLAQGGFYADLYNSQFEEAI